MAASIPGFDPNTFDAHWAALDPDAQTDFIRKAGFLPPSSGILPVLEGLLSFNFNSRTAAKNSLKEIADTLKNGLKHPVDSEEYRDGLSEITRVSARIYQFLRHLVLVSGFQFKYNYT